MLLYQYFINLLFTGEWLFDWLTRWGWPAMSMAFVSVLAFGFAIVLRSNIKWFGISLVTAWLFAILSITARMYWFCMGMSYTTTPPLVKAMFWLDSAASSLILPFFLTGVALWRMRKNWNLKSGKILCYCSVFIFFALAIVSHFAAVTAYRLSIGDIVGIGVLSAE